MQQYCRIGRGAFVGGVTGVPDDVIPYGMVWGDHARLSGLNLIGLKRRGVPRERIHALRAAFRFIFHGEGTLADRAREAADAVGIRLKSPKSSPSFSPTRSGRSACRREPVGHSPMRTSDPMAAAPNTLGIIAGSGRLPLAVAEAAQHDGRDGLRAGARRHGGTGGRFAVSSWLGVARRDRQGDQAAQGRRLLRADDGGQGAAAGVHQAQARCARRAGAAARDRSGDEGRRRPASDDDDDFRARRHACDRSGRSRARTCWRRTVRSGDSNRARITTPISSTAFALR